ncbi:MAG: MmgE/PrpD family protein [Cellulosimicrobium cellulans]
MNSSAELSGPGATGVLAAFAAGSVKASRSHADEVSHALVDTVGVAVGAAKQPGDQILRAWSAAEGASGQATIWTSGETTSASMAALVNGAAAHLLDYDDISPSMPMHPSAVLFPALLAVAEPRRISGERLVSAYDVGAATFRALADLLPQHVHYARGWHTTSTVGRLAAVAALARLVGAGEDVTRNALGMASSLAAGSRPNFGSMTKPFHAGAAARDAVMALELAEAGFTANINELEAPAGFLERYGDPELAPLGDAGETLGERLEYWLESWPGDWGLKRYPACYGTHRGIDAVLGLRAEVAGRTAQAIRATVHPRGTRPLVAYPPKDATAAKFSLEYALATALVRGEVRFSDFTEDAFADGAVRAVMARVTVAESAIPPLGEAGFTSGYAVVDVELEDGETLSRRIDITRGDARNRLSGVEVRSKFLDCADFGGLSKDAAVELYKALSALTGGGELASFSAALSRHARTAHKEAVA